MKKIGILILLSAVAFATTSAQRNEALIGYQPIPMGRGMLITIKDNVLAEQIFNQIPATNQQKDGSVIIRKTQQITCMKGETTTCMTIVGDGTFTRVD